MKDQLAKFREAAHELEASWEEQLVTDYPTELPDFTELVMQLDGIKVGEPEELLVRLLEADGIWDDQVDFRDHNTGAVFIGDARKMQLGVDWSINGEWQVVCYWAAGEGEAPRQSSMDLSPDGLNIIATSTAEDVFAAIMPLVRAFRRTPAPRPTVRVRLYGGMPSQQILSETLTEVGSARDMGLPGPTMVHRVTVEVA